MGVKNLVKKVLIGQQNKAYENALASKIFTYDRWIKLREEEWAQGSFKTPENKSVGDAERKRAGELVFFVSEKGSLSEYAEKYCCEWFSKHPECKLVYGDEDVWLDGAGERTNPWFKPDWSPDLLDSYFYFGSVVVMTGEFYQQTLEQWAIVPKTIEQLGKNTTQMNTQTKDKSLEYRYYVLSEEACDWIRRCAVWAGGYERGGAVGTNGAIGHIPKILFHCNTQESIQCYCNGAKDSGYGSDLRDSCDKSDKCHESVGYHNSGRREDTLGLDKISIIIPSKDNPGILEKCVQGIKKAESVSFYDIEIIIVDNGSNEENKQRIQDMLQTYRGKSDGKYDEEYDVKIGVKHDGKSKRKGESQGLDITYIYEPMEFHFSKMCNLGAEAASGNLLLFLNDDVELCRPGCLERMAELAARPYTGAVGLKLYYPDSIRMQHAGITNLPMGPVHKLQFLEDNTSYYFHANRGLRNVLAVTAACMMVEKKKFLEAGGFAEELRVAFNDVDLCYNLYEHGYVNVCVNDSYAYHYESLSRGDDEATEKLERLLRERDVLYKRHSKLEGVDPYFSENLARQGLDTRIRPAYETAGNMTQQVSGCGKGVCNCKMYAQKSENTIPWGYRDFSGYRQDNCLLLRVESVIAGRMQGYSVVLGDDNSCYERELLFLPVEADKGLSTEVEKACFFVKIEGQYRPDLVENMPDQSHVGLCGFDLQLSMGNVGYSPEPNQKTEGLPTGDYRIGMAVRNRVTGLKLMNVSNRIVRL